MAITSIGTLGTANSISADQSSLALTLTADCEVGNLAVLIIAVDNNQTTDGDESAVSSVTDSAGNTWLKAIGFCNGQGAAQAGATVSVWYTVATSQINNGGSITANFTNATSRDASAMTAWEFDIGTSAVTIAGSTTLAVDAGPVGTAITLSGLSSQEYLWIRAQAVEGINNLGTVTASYTRISDAAASTGTAATSMIALGEFIIATGTSQTSDPSQITNRDSAIVMIAIAESAGGPVMPIFHHHYAQQGA